jgi:hypothetical protein
VLLWPHGGPDGFQVRLVPLGEAKPIDRAVHAWRDHILQSGEPNDKAGRPRLLKGRRGWRVEDRRKADASEEALRAAPRPRLLYCLTHGFFLEDRPRPAATGRRTAGSRTGRSQNGGEPKGSRSVSLVVVLAALVPEGVP